MHVSINVDATAFELELLLEPAIISIVTIQTLRAINELRMIFLRIKGLDPVVHCNTVGVSTDSLLSAVLRNILAHELLLTTVVCDIIVL